MNRAMQFAYLDFFTLKPYIKSFYMLTVIVLIMGISSESISMISSLFMMGLMFMLSLPFSVGEKNGLDILYLTLPIRRRDIIIGRYFLVLFMEIAGIIFVTLLSLLISAFFTINIYTTEMFFVLCILFASFSLVISIQYPIYFKYGYIKGKGIAKIPIFILFLVIVMWSSIGEKLIPLSSLNTIWEVISVKPYLMYGVPIGIGLLALMLSCALSHKLYQKRDI